MKVLSSDKRKIPRMSPWTFNEGQKVENVFSIHFYQNKKSFQYRITLSTQYNSEHSGVLYT